MDNRRTSEADAPSSMWEDWSWLKRMISQRDWHALQCNWKIKRLSISKHTPMISYYNQWRIYPLAKSAMAPPLAKNMRFWHIKNWENLVWPPLCESTNWSYPSELRRLTPLEVTELRRLPPARSHRTTPTTPLEARSHRTTPTTPLKVTELRRLPPRKIHGPPFWIPKYATDYNSYIIFLFLFSAQKNSQKYMKLKSKQLYKIYSVITDIIRMSLDHHQSRNRITRKVGKQNNWWSKFWSFEVHSWSYGSNWMILAII